MDTKIETRYVLIAFGVLSGLSIIVAFLKTWKWFSRSGRNVIDLIVGIF